MDKKDILILIEMVKAKKSNEEIYAFLRKNCTVVEVCHMLTLASVVTHRNNSN